MSSLSTLSECATGSGSELGVGTCCVDVLNLILLSTQSIDRLYWVSQLCPRTIFQSESNGVTLPEGKQMSNLRSERVGVGKSGCVELGLHWCTVRNNATPTLCGVLGVAIYFFASVEAVVLASDMFMVVAVAALALAA